MSGLVEPALDSSIPERPCTVVLAEDPIYPKSWRQTFETNLPEQYGISFNYFQLSNGEEHSIQTMDEALTIMSRDLNHSTSSHETVLIARGPWISWMAQFYLESLPLAGLLLMDPIPLDDVNGINQFKLLYEKKQLEGSLEFSLFREFTEHWDHYSLRVEPGSVPMSVAYSFASRAAFKRTAENTARRHHPDYLKTEVDPVLRVHKFPIDQKDHELHVLQHTVEWIEEEVL